MSLESGTRFGQYEVSGLLGRGGMGEVYRAVDTKLQRSVALKILPAVFSGDNDRLTRFQREARVLASLNHPQIGAIYGLAEVDGQQALVLEAAHEGGIVHRDLKPANIKLMAPSTPAGQALGISVVPVRGACLRSCGER